MKHVEEIAIFRVEFMTLKIPLLGLFTLQDE